MHEHAPHVSKEDFIRRNRYDRRQPKIIKIIFPHRLFFPPGSVLDSLVTLYENVNKAE